MGALVVGYDGGGVLGGGEIFKGGEVVVDGILALLEGSGGVLKTLLPALLALSGARVELLEPLEHFVERLGYDRVHRSPCSLQTSEVLVGCRHGLQSSSMPRFRQVLISGMLATSDH